MAHINKAKNIEFNYYKKKNAILILHGVIYEDVNFLSENNLS